MILIFQEDGLVHIAPDEAAVKRHCEGIDVLGGVYQFYDDSGNALKPVFDAPVVQSKILWFVRIIGAGRYHLEPDLESIGDPLWVSMCDAVAIEPNGQFANLQQLKEFLRERGVTVDRP